ncbi:MAG: tetratricopeptide repeat protein [Planctomycetota bacterium]|nr:tetratricopeptide repeat protein [Planctomycetota bacterium]
MNRPGAMIGNRNNSHANWIVGVAIVGLAASVDCSEQEGMAPQARSGPHGTATNREDRAVSLLGRPLLGRPLLPAETTQDDKRLKELADARRHLAERPDDPDRVIWVGRRLGYLWRMNDAIDVFTEGITAHPDYAPLYRHRGHRYISLRRFDKALDDLERAAELIRGQPSEVEPDGLPNTRNIPLTTTAFNVWYHLGLARYLKGDYKGALSAYHRTMQFSHRYDDNLVATTYWTYLTLRRLGWSVDAKSILRPIRRDMDIIENHAYHRLLLVFKGVATPENVIEEFESVRVDAATFGYGLGMGHLLNGEPDLARKAFVRVVEIGPWPAFGAIAAEVELARSGD